MAAPFIAYGESVERYANLGYLPLPIRHASKRPAVGDWTRLSPAKAIALALQHQHDGLGARTDNLAAIDVDVRNDNAATDLLNYLQRMVIQAAPALIRYGRPPKFMVLCQAEGPSGKRSSPLYRDAQGVEHRIECLGTGQQVVLAGIHPDTQEPYFWAHGDPVQQDVAVYELPVLTEAQWEALVKHFRKLAEAQGWERVSGASQAPGGDDDAPTWPVAGLTLDLAREALEHYPNDDLHYDDWVDVGMALHQQGQGEVDWFEAWDAWSATSGKYSGQGGKDGTWTKWQGFDASRPGGITMRSVLMRAEDNGWQRPESVEGARAEQDAFEEAEVEEDLGQEGGATEEDSGKPDTQILSASTPADWGEYVPPPLKWIWYDRIPVGDTTLVYAKGGTGKTTLMTQLASAIAAGEQKFLGADVLHGKVLMFMCEDDRDDLIRRQDRLERNGGPSRQALGDRLVMVPRKGTDNVLMRFDRNGKAGPTATWWQLRATCEAHKGDTRLVVVDGKADVFSGNENDTVQARQFIQRALTSLAMEFQCAVVLIAHPSRGGVSSGEGDGASMQWDAAVKSRLYLKPELDREGTPTGITILSHMKSNRSARQGDVKMRMVDGVFAEIAPEEQIHNPDHEHCRRDLIEVLRKAGERGDILKDAPNSDNPFWKYAAVDQHGRPGSVTWSETQWKVAMMQLVDMKLVEKYRYSKDKSRTGMAYRLTNQGFFSDQAEDDE